MYSIVSEEAGLLPRERLLQKGAEVLSDQELVGDSAANRDQV